MRLMAQLGAEVPTGHAGRWAPGSAQLLVRSISSFLLFYRTQSRIGSPVSTQHTGPSRTVRRYPASNGQLTSNTLPNGHGHEQGSSGPNAAFQEHTLAARGKASRDVTAGVSCWVLRCHWEGQWCEWEYHSHGVTSKVTGGASHLCNTLEMGSGGEDSPSPRRRREQNGGKTENWKRGVRMVTLQALAKRDSTEGKQNAGGRGDVTDASQSF